MRTLKFRAWDENAKRMNYFDNPKDGILYCCNGFIVSNGWDSHKDPTFDTRPDKKDVIEQYTGIDDKNGTPIYEGDIVEWTNGLEEKHIFEIIWNECKASFQMVEMGQEYPYMLQGLSDKMKPYCEVISNIHENEELLDGDKD